MTLTAAVIPVKSVRLCPLLGDFLCAQATRVMRGLRMNGDAEILILTAQSGFGHRLKHVGADLAVTFRSDETGLKSTADQLKAAASHGRVQRLCEGRSRRRSAFCGRRPYVLRAGHLVSSAGKCSGGKWWQAAYGKPARQVRQALDLASDDPAWVGPQAEAAQRSGCWHRSRARSRRCRPRHRSAPE
jgi:hypothetical protein